MQRSMSSISSSSMVRRRSSPATGWPAIERLVVLHDRLVPGATVVLDDIERAGEQEVLRRWEDEFDLVFRRIGDAGVAVATMPGPSLGRHVGALR